MTTDLAMSLPHARSRLDDAVHALIGTQVADVARDKGTVRAWGASRYQQLTESLDTPKATGRTMRAGSQPPVWVDAVDLRRRIDSTVSGWWPHCEELGCERDGVGTEPTLHAIVDNQWRPQDVSGIVHISNTCNRFAADIDRLFDPPKRANLAAPCPECNESIVYRPDAAGETVRRPALDLTTDGCTCLACGEHWPPQLFMHLSRLIGHIPPVVDTPVDL